MNTENLSTSPSLPELDRLLANVAWLRVLATQISGRVDLADDAVQSVWEAVLRRPPRLQGAAGPWLARVVRNAVYKGQRGERRRQHHEALAAAEHPLEAESAETHFARAEAYKILAELVAGLEDRQRQVVLLRYHDDKNASQIAAELGVPAGTVRRWLKEARDALAAGMDARHHGKRDAWAGLFLAPLPAQIMAGANASPTPMASTAAPKVAVALAALSAAAWMLLAAKTPEERMALVPQTLQPASILSLPEAPLGQLNVAVTDPEDKPLSAIAVHLRCKYGCAEGSWQPQNTTTDPEGQAQYRGVPEGVFEVAARGAGGISARAEVSVQPFASQDVRLVLRANAGAFTLAGTVFDDGGGTIPGTVVAATRGSDGATFLATADEAGRYQVQLDRGFHSLEASADGYARKNTALHMEADAVMNFNMSPGSGLSGQVIGVDGAPVADALVELKRLYSTSSLRTRADGHFAAAQLEVGDYAILARLGRASGVAEKGTTLAAGEHKDVGVIVLHTMPLIRGRVFTGQGAPVPHADVLIAAAPHDDPAFLIERSKVHKADESGSFQLQALEPGRYQLRAGTDGWAWKATSFTLGEDDVTLELRLPPEVRVRGRVLDLRGRPVAGATVSLATKTLPTMDGTFTGGSFRTTDKNGSFDADQLGAGWLTVEVQHTEHGAFEDKPVEVQAGDIKDLVLRFSKTVFASGTVTWDDGSPAAGVSVSWQGGAMLPRTVTDAAGKFKLGPLPRSEGDVEAEPPDVPAFSLPGGHNSRAYVDARTGVDATGIKLILPRQNRRIVGRAIGPKGEPLSGATIYAGGEDQRLHDFQLDYVHKVSSGNDGRFVIERVSARRFALTGRAQGYAPTFLSPVSTDKEVTLHFHHPGSIAGQVKDAQGRVATRFEVAAEPHIETPLWDQFVFGSPQIMFRKVGDASGRFRIDGLSAGVYDVLCRFPSGEIAVAIGVKVASDEESDVEMKARVPARISGRLVDAETKMGIKNIGLEVAMREGFVHATSDDEGRFTIADAYPGRWTLVSVRALPPYLHEYIAAYVPLDQSALDLGEVPLVAFPQPTAPVQHLEARGHVGIGILPGNFEGRIGKVVAGSHAAAAGVKVGSQLVSVNGRDVRGLGSFFIGSTLRGPVGSISEITLRTTSGALQTVKVKLLGIEEIESGL